LKQKLRLQEEQLAKLQKALDAAVPRRKKSGSALASDSSISGSDTGSEALSSDRMKKGVGRRIG